jgi:hypothetical protein
MSMFKPATRKKLKLRMALDGPTGSGKSYTAFRAAHGIAGPDARIAVIDTEHEAMAKYLGENPDGTPWKFEVCDLEYYAPSTYTAAIREAGRLGFDVLIIDSLSHAWQGVGGALDQVDRKGGNSFTAWKDVTPMHTEMIEAILSSPCHVIATMRSKMDYVLEEQTNKQGKVVQVPKKVGMAPIQRAGTEYEFDVVCDIDGDHTLTVAKTRCSIMDGRKAVRPGPEFFATLRAWLDDGAADMRPQPPATHVPPAEFVPPPPQAFPQTATAARRGPVFGGNAVMDAATSIRDSDYCTASHREQIVDLAQKLGLEPSDILAVLARRNVQRIGELTVKQADDLIASMNHRYVEQQAGEAFGGGGDDGGDDDGGRNNGTAPALEAAGDPF